MQAMHINKSQRFSPKYIPLYLVSKKIKHNK